MTDSKKELVIKPAEGEPNMWVVGLSGGGRTPKAFEGIVYSRRRFAEHDIEKYLASQAKPAKSTK